MLARPLMDQPGWMSRYLVKTWIGALRALITFADLQPISIVVEISKGLDAMRTPAIGGSLTEIIYPPDLVYASYVLSRRLA